MHAFSRLVALLLLLLLVLPAGAPAQNFVRVPPFSGTNYLNDFIAGDTLANGTRRDANAVYVLQRGANYLVNAVLQNTGYTLRIQANDTTGNVPRPVVFLYQNPTTQLPPGQFVSMRGDVIIKNVIISGYFEPIPANLSGLQGALFNMTAAGFSISLDSCILTNTNGNHLRTDSAPHKVQVTNCIFANMGYLGRSNLGAGKAMDVRGGSVDSLIVLNTTFVNAQDRTIRHFSSTANIQYLRFEHNTIVNNMAYHGLLSLGRVGRRAIIQNNLLVDAFAAGQDTDAVRQAEFTDSGEKDAFGFPRMTWVISVPNDSTRWTVKNNYYRITPAGQAFFDSASFLPIVANPPLTKGSPLTYHINSKLGADSATAFQVTTVDLNNTPRVMTAMMKWYRRPAAPPDSGAGKTKATGAWKSQFDFDRRPYQYFRDTLNCAYATSAPIYTAGTGGFPVGDLNWFPSRLAAWRNDPVSSVPASSEIPERYVLTQNFPNPFNPATVITFSAPRLAPVTLEVFDLLGRRVVTLVNETVTAGEHSVRFDGSSLASGMYVYRLSAAGQVMARKMMLVK